MLFRSGGGYSGAGGIINITSGTVEATSGSGAGIGGGYSGAGGIISITSGTVEATSGSGAGIGGGEYGAAGTFTTPNGNAFILASSIQDASGLTNGVIFQGDSGKVYGGPITIDSSVEIPAGKTLTIDKDQTLIIPDGVTLTNKGTITNDGTITNNGTITRSEERRVGKECRL